MDATKKPTADEKSRDAEELLLHAEMYNVILTSAAGKNMKPEEVQNTMIALRLHKD